MCEDVTLGSMSTLVAGGSTVEAASLLIASGHDAMSEVPLMRWNPHAALQEPAKLMDSRCRYGGFVMNVQLFDHFAFAISAAEAAAMDPQQRILLEQGYVTLHLTRLERTELEGSITGVFLGMCASDYVGVLAASPASRSVYASTAVAPSVACGRLSYVIGLHGPSISYDTACSASLVASHAGMRAMQLDECSVGLVQGASLMFTPSMHVMLATAGMTSPRGRCHTFDERADGYARGDAISTGTTVHGNAAICFLSSAVRSDGRSASLTAPNGQAQ